MSAAPTLPLHHTEARRGKAPSLPELRRDTPFTLRLTRGDVADLKAIAEGWSVPVALAGWALLETELERSRKRMLCHPRLTLPLSAAVDMLRAAGWHVTRGSE